MYLCKQNLHYKISAPKKVHILTISREFCRNNRVFVQNICAFIKVTAPRKVHILTISREFGRFSAIYQSICTKKSRIYKSISHEERSYFDNLGVNFDDFRRNSVFMEKKSRI